MPPGSDTSDLRALARVILDQEDLEQSVGGRGPGYELSPVHRRFVEGVRVGLLMGVAVGLASTGAGTATTFREPASLQYFVLFTIAGTSLGAIAGAALGLSVRWSQRRRLDAELVSLVQDPPP
jgi:cation transporter-like permease